MILRNTRLLPTVMTAFCAASSAHAQSNDCAAPTPIVIGTATPISNAGLTATAASGGTCAGTAPDGWFSLTAPSNGVATLTVTGWVASVGAFIDCTGTPAQIGCANANSISFPVTSGSTYLLRVARRGGATTGTATVTVAAPVAGDECSSPIPAFAAPNFFDISGALTNGPSANCPSPGTSDLFFSYTAAANGTLRVSTIGTSFGTVLSVLDSCAGSQIACNDNFFDGATNIRSRVAFQAVTGQQFIFRVARDTNTATTTTGVLNIEEFSTPANDTCATATPVTEGSFPWDNTGALSNNAVCSGAIGAEADVWFAYTPSRSDTVSIDTGASPQTTIGAFADCITATPIACGGTGIGVSPVSFPVVAGQTVFLRVATAAGTYELGTLNIVLSCRADFNGAGGVTVQDIFDFIAAYFAADSRADFNGVGGITVQDIFDFLAAYFAGC